MVGVSTDVAGIVSAIAVQENQKVARRRRAVPARPAAVPARARPRRGAARLDPQRSDRAAGELPNMQAQIAQAQADIDYLRRHLPAPAAPGDEQLHAAGDVSTGAARPAGGAAEARLAEAAACRRCRHAQRRCPTLPVEDHPHYKEALAARDEAARQLDHTTVRAPFDGIVTNVPSLQPGQYLAAAHQAFSLVSTDRLSGCRRSPKETELTYVKPGQKVIVEVDTYPGVEWNGTVESVSPASASSFSLLPAQNTSGNWVKVVQRIPMRVKIDDTRRQAAAARRHERRAVDVDTGHARGVPVVIRDLFGIERGERPEPWPAQSHAEAVVRPSPIAARSPACVILAVIMQALDTTIANVALPYIQGSVSASADQINWVLTSYIVAAAIMTPPSGFLANRFGRKRVLLIAIVGFVVASMLCGLAQSLTEIVGFRLLQGLFGAALVPIVAGHPARHLLARGARLGDGAVRRLGHGRPGARAGDRRLADRQSQLALGLLHQPADRRARLRRHLRSSCHETKAASRSEARLARLRHAQPRHRRAAALPRPRRAARLVLLGRNHDRGRRLRLALLPLPRPHLHGAKNPSSIRACSSTATLPSACSSSSSSASPIWPRWR